MDFYWHLETIIFASAKKLDMCYFTLIMTFTYVLSLDTNTVIDKTTLS